MNSEQTANILAFYSYYHPKATVDEIALDFKLPVAVIVNGLYYGERNGLYTAKKKGPQYKEITVEAVPDVNADFGKDLERVKGLIYEVVTNVNSDEKDITDENLYIWLGVPLIVSKVALRLLLNEGKLAKYTIADPKDKKSKYHFYTLIENKDKLFGKQEFKVQPKKKDIKKSEPVS